jgi:hypothetical protein
LNELLKKVSVLFSQIYADSKTYFSNAYSQSGAVFGPSSAYGQLLTAISAFTQRVFFYIEDSITELNIYTATRKSSVYGLARLAGHNPTRAVGATGDIDLTFTGETIQAANNQVVIPNFTTIQCVNNGLFYTILAPREEIRMNIGQRNSVRVKMVQGKIESQSFTGTGQSLQTYNALVKNNNNIDNFYVNVYVNGEEYKIYDSFYDMPMGAAGCLVRTSVSNGIDVIFGNEQYGKVPDTGSTIVVQYLLTDGAYGNIIDFTEKAKFKFIDQVFDAVGNTIDVNNGINISLASRVVLGSFPEPVELTKIIAPKVSRSLVLARPENYVYFLQRLNYFSVVDAFDTFGDDYLDDDNVVYVYLVPEIKKRLKTNENYFTVNVEKFTLFDDEVKKIRDYVQESGSMLVTSEMRILRPIIKRYVVNISLVIFDNISVDLLKSEVVSKLNEYLLSFVRRDRIPQSDIVSILEGVNGIDSVNVRFMSEENEKVKSEWLQAVSVSPGIPEPADVGLDSQGDIIIGKGELPLVRGGWYDRYGNYFNDTVDFAVPCSVNIEIKEVLSPSIYNKLAMDKIKKLKSS